MKNQALDFDRQVQGFAVQLIGALSALSPVIIIIAMLGAFTWIGYMDFLYFNATLPASGLAILAAIFLQSMRFGTALGSVRMFKAGKISGILFLGASLILTYLESGHVINQAAALAATPDAIKANVYLIKLAVWASIGLEFLVAVLFSAMFAELESSNQGDQVNESEPVRAELDQAQERAPSTTSKRKPAIAPEALDQVKSNGAHVGNGKAPL